MNALRTLTAAAALLVVGLPFCFASPLAAQESPDDLGRTVYDKWCAGCHGVDGSGNGPAAGYMLPRPRDFTTALYQVRTTASGELPTDSDILRIIDDGMPGTAMPGWREVLTRDERNALVEYLKSFSPFFANSPPPEPIDFGSPPRATEEALAEGRELWEEVECAQCHGEAGRGDGTSAPTLEDTQGRPIRAADLTENWLFNGGGTVEDIYRRFRTGMDGTPMPSNSDLIDAGIYTAEQLWNLAHYVRSLAPEDPPSLTEVIRASRIEEGTLPNSVDEEAWDEVERFYVPLVGQIIVRPRWFDPRVDGVWVQALHNDEELVMRLSWSDPSRSPDSAWADWRARVTEIMEPDDSVAFEEGPLPDRFAVQFPVQMPQGQERPYFLMGDSRRPVNLWLWSSDGAGGREALARGIEAIEENPGSTDLTTDAAFSDGQWRLLFRRALTTEDEGIDVQIPVGRAVPVAFYAWDGDHGEAGSRGAVSSWYFVYLTRPASATVFVAPLVALVLTAVLGVAVVARAQRGTRAEPAAQRPEASLEGV